ncbi:VOC family protein [Parabacteroides sp. OttesenSCG-928-J18]|nr:VOC family protein [Parabacteroides sp. OttesenSCG-928-J18]
MKIEHIAFWVDDIEKMREFYLHYFNLSCGDKYVNPTKNYTSYFLTFNEGGSRIELMNRPDTIASEPRTSGDGYYESAVLDPEGNYIELLG